MRVPDWEDRLIAKSMRPHKFEWGVCDCALDGADWVLEITGVDIARKFRGKYKTLRGAVGALKRYGEGSLSATMDSLLPRIEDHEVTNRGDLVGVPCETPELFDCAIGVSDGLTVKVLGPEGDLISVPISDRLFAWRVC